MSVIVKGLKMPTSCTRCTLDAFGYCTAARRYSEGSTTHERASFCPLVELPEKHGRLIDADALIAKRGGLAVDSENIVELSPGWTIPLESVIDIEPTVVEAEDK